jgi:hypothetical protein
MARVIFPFSPEAFCIKNNSDEFDASAVCGVKLRGMRVLFSEEVSKLRIDGLFTRMKELVNNVEMIRMGFINPVDFLSENRVGGTEANSA